MSTWCSATLYANTDEGIFDHQAKMYQAAANPLSQVGSCSVHLVAEYAHTVISLA